MNGMPLILLNDKKKFNAVKKLHNSKRKWVILMSDYVIMSTKSGPMITFLIIVFSQQTLVPRQGYVLILNLFD